MLHISSTTRTTHIFRGTRGTEVVEDNNYQSFQDSSLLSIRLWILLKDQRRIGPTKAKGVAHGVAIAMI
jgi:hypothetical protein